MTWNKVTQVKTHQGSLSGRKQAFLRQHWISQSSPEQRLIRSDLCVKVVDVVEEPKIIIDLQNYRRYRTGQGDQVDPFNPQARLWLEHGS